MKKILIFCVAIIRFANLHSQDSAEYYNQLFHIVQQKPQFPGSEPKWLAEHIIYPKQAVDSNVQGTVYLSLIIERDGSVDSVKVLKGIVGGGSLGSEAVRVVSGMPKWNPGIERGHIVRVQLTLPVNFKLIKTLIVYMVMAK
jgi:protein TonB